MSAKIKLIVSAFGMCLLTLLSPSCVFGSSQKIIFHEQPNCPVTGLNHTITETNTNLRSSWVANSSTSALVVGIWKINVENVTNGGTKYRLSPTNAFPPGGRCINKSEWPLSGWENYTIYEAERFGPVDMTTSQLILYRGSDFNGTTFPITFDMDLLSSLQFQSYAHFSNDSWTVYSQANYMGTATVLSPNPANGRDNFAYVKNANMLIGSVRKGQHLTPTTQPTTTTTEKSAGNRRVRNNNYKFAIIFLILGVISTLT